MSATQPPRRRVSPKVYRRRRLVVLLGLVVVVVVVLLVILKPGSGKAETAAVLPTAAATNGGAAGGLGATPGVTGSATDPAATGAAADPAGAATGGATGAAAPTDAAADPAATAAPASAAPASAAPAAGADGSQACAAGNITVTAITDSNDYSSGNQPMLSFSIVNTGSQPCTINAGTSKQVYTITSGTEVYWLSTDCQTGATDTMAMLAPGQLVTSTPFAWNRTRSSPSTCDSASPVSAPAGGASYHLSVSVDGIQAAQTAQFILE
ncbi:hypothetical protein [Subtercola sp. YIM 133946]|uniref:hypothetical protein n=1 Tax=Subtercola sp. YIM 133946 TaxID=3118909 RepID=UPI002F941739